MWSGVSRVSECNQDEQGGENASKPKGKRSKPKIPARYNTKSELEANVKAGENVFDFTLASQAGKA